MELFGTELYGDQQWTVSETDPSSEKYEVRLYFAEIYHGVSNNEGESARVFDVTIEGQNPDVLDRRGVRASYPPTVRRRNSQLVSGIRIFRPSRNLDVYDVVRRRFLTSVGIAFVLNHKFYFYSLK